MPCCKVGSGQYAGNAWNNPNFSARQTQPSNGEGIEIINGVPYAKTSISVNNMIPILSAIGGVGQGLSSVSQGLVQKKLGQVEAGTKEFSQPKTGAGRLIGRLTGRTQASDMQQAGRTTGAVSPTVGNVLGRQGIPVSGK